jgi:CBS domain-containing protein
VWHGKTAADVLASKRERSEEKTLRSWLLARSHRHTVGEHASVLAAAKQMEKENLTFLVVVREQEGLPEDVRRNSGPRAILGALWVILGALRYSGFSRVL